MTRCRCLAPGDGYGRCPGPSNCPLCQEPEDFDAESAAELIPLAWLECMGDAMDFVADVPRVLGFVPTPGSISADAFLERIQDCQDAGWLLVLAANRPEWATPAMRRWAELCKATPCWANWLQACQDDHDKAVARAAKDEAEAWADRRAA